MNDIKLIFYLNIIPNITEYKIFSKIFLHKFTGSNYVLIYNISAPNKNFHQNKKNDLQWNDLTKTIKLLSQ